MPTWAYIYCGFIVCNSLFCLVAKNRLKRSYQPAGELLDSLLAICIFLIAYGVVQFEHEKLISTVAFILTFAWSYHAHRQFLDFQSFKQKLHKTYKEIDTKLLEKYGEDYEPTYNFDDTEKKAKNLSTGLWFFLVFAATPYLYAYLLSMGIFK